MEFGVEDGDLDAVGGQDVAVGVLDPADQPGWPQAAHRVLRNETLEAWEAVGCPPPGARPGENDVIAYTQNGAEMNAFPNNRLFWCTRGSIPTSPPPRSATS